MENNAVSHRRQTITVWYLLLAVVFLTLAYRLATLPMVWVWADMVVKWWAAIQFSDLGWRVFGNNHHDARLGINLVVLAVQKLFGTHPTLYYVPALTMSVMLSGFLLFIGRQIAGVTLGVAVSVLAIFHPAFIGQGTQLIPSIFSSAYVMGALYFLGRNLVGQPEKIRANLIFSALFFFLAYLSKVSNLFFLPALAIGVWAARRELKDVVFYLALLLGMAAAEWVFYFFVHDSLTGRFGPLSVHLSRVDQFVANMGYGESEFGWSDMVLERFTPRGVFSLSLAVTVIPGLACAIFQLFYNPVLRSIRTTMMLAMLCYGFLTAVAAIDFSPLTPVEPFRPRFQTIFVPFALLAIVLTVDDVFRWLGRRLHSSRMAPKLGTLGVVLISSSMGALFVADGKGAIVTDYERHPFAILPVYLSLALDTERNCLPVISEGANAEKAFRAYFMHGYQRYVRNPTTDGTNLRIGFDGACRDRYPDLQTYLTEKRDDREVVAVHISTKKDRYWGSIKVSMSTISFADLTKKFPYP